MDKTQVDSATIERCARLSLAAITRPYPFAVGHVVMEDGDVWAPRDLWPAFHNAFDWHSSVHGHWCLIRALRVIDDRTFQSEVRAALAKNLTTTRLAAEADYLSAPGRQGFERPYGLAWLLRLASELREWTDSDGIRWRAAIEPLEKAARDRLFEWLPRLPFPIRSGEHSQSAFAMGLALDWANQVGDEPFSMMIIERTQTLYGGDTHAPIAYEPSGHDFLSPALAEADLMRRALVPADFGEWLPRFLPDPLKPAMQRWLTPVQSPDPSDGKLAHLDGLNLSRAWMLDGIASSLDAETPHARFMRSAAAAHLDGGLEGVSEEHYAGSHWLGSFAVYALTRRGVREPVA